MKINKILNCDIIVVGSGIGGLTAAKKAAERGRNVILVTNGKLCGGASYFPLKGTLGIQATADQKEDLDFFKNDIRTIGRGMENPHMIDTYIKDIKESITSLNEIGFKPWLRNDKRPACFAKYARDIFLINEWEKAKEEAKIIFKNIENIKIKEQAKIIKILKYNNKTAGAVFQSNEGELFIIKAPVIIMASGGIAGLYEHNLYPSDIDGSGHVVLLDAGAQLQNMEFIQFIPAFIKPVYNTLFGEHTLKYCLGMYTHDDKKLFSGIEDKNIKDLWLERSSYAPFSCDFKSSVIDLKMADNINGVKLKFHKDLYLDEGEFYKVYLDWLKKSIGIDMCNDEVVVAPFAHSCNGGVKVSCNGETNIPGIFAAGEIISGVEGANRLGGNSVGGALVFGRRAACTADEYIKNNPLENISNEYLKNEFTNWVNSLESNNTTKSSSKNDIIKSIKKLITEKGGIKRNGEKLKEALIEIEKIKKDYNIKTSNKIDFEIYFKTETAKVLFTAMLNREESRGAHYREDFPKQSDIVYKIIVFKENGYIKVKKEYN
ncbi:FAD-binding protein [Fusobacterium perfoetens]|uniref:FAD-binding protein n=1 Tax=Fusobacterium perfoetens TaxID=852 RepID=UPI001F26A3C8|nr:FAD-binding protein [Fusobacterium perfoetens]MCF2625897.1 FAD-binding protein [Fusobacterium perfoetens]